jgi:hypothetical protein
VLRLSLRSVVADPCRGTHLAYSLVETAMLVVAVHRAAATWSKREYVMIESLSNMKISQIVKTW